MIREFRVWDKENKCYWNNSSNSYLLSLKGVFLSEVSGDAGEIEAIEPDPEDEKRFIFEQSIDRKDKKGKKIFEGDICKAIQVDNYYTDDQPKEIITAITIEYVTELSTMNSGGPDGTTEFKDIEVIGNINENPELLKQVGEQE